MLTQLLETGSLERLPNKESWIGQERYKRQPEAKSLFQVREDDKE